MSGVVRFVNVSVDLDGLSCYHQIHRIDAPADPTAVYDLALPRFLDLFAELGVRATLFVIASDLRHPRVVRLLRAAIEAGHEVASHAYHHPYDLRRWSRAAIAQEIDLAQHAIGDALGVQAVGFRTPGYNVDDAILDVLEERGFRYDSSVLPCPSYYAAKSAVLAVMRMTGRASGSSPTLPSTTLAPIDPYRPSRAHFALRGAAGDCRALWEVPMGAIPGIRAPVIGTTICATPVAAVPALASLFASGRPSLQVELHGVDLLDAGDAPVDAALARAQPDLRRRWTAKRASLAALVRALTQEYASMTLRDAVALLDDTAPMAS